MKLNKYERDKAVAYAEKWALSRNPDYYNFDLLGGDCTNFISQCIFAGCGHMNFTPVKGWYYIDLNSRAPAWTGVRYLYNFLIGNDGAGPYAKEVPYENAEEGDVVQLGNAESIFYHSLIITLKTGQKNSFSDFFVCAHSFNAKNKRLSEYRFAQARFLHIYGTRS